MVARPFTMLATGSGKRVYGAITAYSLTVDCSTSVLYQVPINMIFDIVDDDLCAPKLWVCFTSNLAAAAS